VEEFFCGPYLLAQNVDPVEEQLRVVHVADTLKREQVGFQHTLHVLVILKLCSVGVIAECRPYHKNRCGQLVPQVMNGQLRQFGPLLELSHLFTLVMACKLVLD